MSGSIAAFKACQVISKLVQNGDEVQVVATKSTFQFIGEMTLEGLSGKKVLTDLWESGRAMDHIHLTRWADFAMVCPASANTIAKLAHGFSEDLLSAMALAWPADKKFFVFPAMNQQMLQASVTQENLKRLEQRGFTVAPTQSGSLACGEEGPGRLLEVEEILARVALKPLGRILVTGGATREPIDGIRFISNVSTGQTAAAISDELTNQGWKVTYLHGVGAKQPQNAHAKGFESFADLNHQMHRELSGEEYAAVIHCAAVSDYSVDSAQPKIKLKTGADLQLKLHPNFKILPRLREYSRNKNIRVIGFKLVLAEDSDHSVKAARKLLAPTVDAVVANEWKAVNGDRSRHPGSLVTAGSTPREFENLRDLSSLLHSFIQKGVAHDSLS
jgi:phosphopantothenoylcysteine decarboxylase / phosphopantothenate---cysteine ligase